VPPAIWIGLAAAAVAAVVTVVAWPDDRDEVVVGGDTSAEPSVASTPTTTVQPTTTVAATTTTAAPTTALAPSGDPLAPGVIEFTGIGQLRLDRPLEDFPGWPTRFELGPLGGILTPDDSRWDEVMGRVTDNDGVLRVDALYALDPRFRTAEGMGVGSTIDELRAAYGDRLREDDIGPPPDAQVPTSDRPIATYVPVASIIDGDLAITFWLGGDESGARIGEVVNVVKVSHDDNAGDDEGCA